MLILKQSKTSKVSRTNQKELFTTYHVREGEDRSFPPLSSSWGKGIANHASSRAQIGTGISTLLYNAVSHGTTDNYTSR